MYAISQMLAETTIDSVRSWRPTGKTQLISSCDNVKHDLESLLEQIGFPCLLSLMRFITFSPPGTRSKPPSLEAFYYFPGILTDCNSLLPASLSLVLVHFNCDFRG